MEKTYTIKVSSERNGRFSEHTTTGTLAELIEAFSYSLEIGASYIRKFNKTPKTIKALLKSLNAASDARHANSYNYTSYELV